MARIELDQTCYCASFNRLEQRLRCWEECFPCTFDQTAYSSERRISADCLTVQMSLLYSIFGTSQQNFGRDMLSYYLFVPEKRPVYLTNGGRPTCHRHLLFSLSSSVWLHLPSTRLSRTGWAIAWEWKAINVYLKSDYALRRRRARNVYWSCKCSKAMRYARLATRRRIFVRAWNVKTSNDALRFYARSVVYNRKKRLLTVR